MPEGQEVELESLHEHIHEAAEHDGGRFLRVVALTTALLAALAAIGSLQAGATVNEALLLKTASTQLQSRASDQWAYYQAKGVKGAIAQGASNAWEAAGKPVPVALTTAAARYTAEQRDISKEATQLEHERDAKSAEADHLLHRHHGFANAVALFQVAIALGAITALTRSRPVFGGSLLLGAVGLVLLALQYLR
ncbi:MAG: DUF4337 family protein [Gemmatimonadaceae bacterium]